MEINKRDVGLRIRSIRKDRGMTLDDFGDLLNPQASDSIVSRWERGVSLPSNERTKQIAELGEISVEELLYGDITNYVDNMIWDYTFDDESGIETGEISKEHFDSQQEVTNFLIWFKNVYLPQYDSSKERYPSYSELLNEFRSYVIENPSFRNKERIEDILSRMKVNAENISSLTLKDIFKQDIETLEEELDL